MSNHAINVNGVPYVLASEYDALAARVAELTDLLTRCSHECQNLSHRRGEFHNYDEACPVSMRIGHALADSGSHK